jgi:hypothetical protein
MLKLSAATVAVSCNAGFDLVAVLMLRVLFLLAVAAAAVVLYVA